MSDALRRAIQAGQCPAHPKAGLWGKSLSVWHILAVTIEGDGSAVDGASNCGVYLGPPYYEGAMGGRTCDVCRHLRGDW